MFALLERAFSMLSLFRGSVESLVDKQVTTLSVCSVRGVVTLLQMLLTAWAHGQRLGGRNDLCSKARSGYSRKDATCVADDQQGGNDGTVPRGL